MKKLFLICCLLAGLGCYSQSNKRFLPVETIELKTKYFDRIEILKYSSPGPGSFHKIDVYNLGKMVYSIEEVYDSVNFIFKNLDNLVKSDLLFIYKNNDYYILNLFGFQYGCCPQTLTLIRIGEDGFSKIFDEEFDGNEISRESNNSVVLNGRLVIPQGLAVIDSLEVALAGYAPTSIFTLRSKVELDSARTIKWNQENYVFRGFTADHDIWIAHPSRKAKKKFKPYVFKEKGAEPPKR